MNEMRKLMEAASSLYDALTQTEDLSEVRINYDSWTTKPPKNLSDKHLAVLRVMSDKQPRERAAMLRAARLDPNPRSENGFAGWNKIDYDLYKMGMLEVVSDKKDRSGISSIKTFRITPTGLNALKTNGKN
jgi:hypothetical protein